MSLGSKYLTKPDPALAAKQAKTYPGMAFFAGTGPDGKTCSQCSQYGFYREGRNEKTRKVNGCKMFWELAGHPGPAFSGDAASCKYFIPKAE